MEQSAGSALTGRAPIPTGAQRRHASPRLGVQATILCSPFPAAITASSAEEPGFRASRNATRRVRVLR